MVIMKGVSSRSREVVVEIGRETSWRLRIEPDVIQWWTAFGLRKDLGHCSVTMRGAKFACTLVLAECVLHSLDRTFPRPSLWELLTKTGVKMQVDKRSFDWVTVSSACRYKEPPRG